MTSPYESIFIAKLNAAFDAAKESSRSAKAAVEKDNSQTREEDTTQPAQETNPTYSHPPARLSSLSETGFSPADFAQGLSEVSVEEPEKEEKKKEKKSEETKHQNLLDTIPTKEQKDFEVFAKGLAVQFSRGKDNLTREDATRDADFVISMMQSGECGAITKPETITKIYDQAVDKGLLQRASEDEKTIFGPFTQRALAEKSNARTATERS